jgi:hypothetical protein
MSARSRASGRPNDRGVEMAERDAEGAVPRRAVEGPARPTDHEQHHEARDDPLGAGRDGAGAEQPTQQDLLGEVRETRRGGTPRRGRGRADGIGDHGPMLSWTRNGRRPRRNQTGADHADRPRGRALPRISHDRHTVQPDDARPPPRREGERRAALDAPEPRARAVRPAARDPGRGSEGPHGRARRDAHPLRRAGHRRRLARAHRARRGRRRRVHRPRDGAGDRPHLRGPVRRVGGDADGGLLAPARDPRVRRRDPPRDRGRGGRDRDGMSSSRRSSSGVGSAHATSS